MKAITLWQPWATLIALGAKPTETRRWATTYRGRLAIHAAKSGPREIVKIARSEPFKSTLADAGYLTFSSLPRSAVLCVVTLEDCVPTEQYKPKSFLESTFGDFSLHRFVWILRDVEVLHKPILARGAQGLWDWDEDGWDHEE